MDIPRCDYCQQLGHERSACEALRIIGCIERYVLTCLREGYAPAVQGGNYLGAWDNLPVEMAHSSLLRRLIAGREPTDPAPPRAYSYPWAELYETGEGYASSASLIAMDVTGNRCPLMIDQGVWELLELREDGARIVRWADGHPRFALSASKDGPLPWHLQRIEA